MARSLGEPASNVAAWKRVGRIPADKQPEVLNKAQELGLDVTADHIVFPLGRPAPADIYASDPCNKIDGASKNVTAPAGRAA